MIRDTWFGYIKDEIKSLEELMWVNLEVVERIVDLISACEGKVVFCGLGKTGMIARRLAGTFSSMGTPSTFIHCSEAVHGDLGFLQKKDVVILLSKTCSAPEHEQVMDFCGRKDIPLVLISSTSQPSRLGCINLMVSFQDDTPAPLNSLTQASVLGNVLARLVALKKDWDSSKWKETHPG